MQSPTPRPDTQPREAERAASGTDAAEGESRLPRREARASAPSAASLKLLDRRAQAARDANARRDEAAKGAAARPLPATETRRSDAPLVQPASTRRNTATLRRAQLALGGGGVAALALLAVPAVPPAVPAALLAVCLGLSFYVTHGLTRPLTALANTSRAVALGDYGTRAAGETGEFAEIARGLNVLLDERAAMIAQTCEQQQRLQNDIHQLTTVVASAADGELTSRASVQTGSLMRLAEELNATLENFAQLVHAVRVGSVSMNEVLSQAQQLAQHLGQSVARQGAGIESSASVLRHVAEGTAAVTESAQVATDAARRTNETAQEGGRMLHRLLEGMITARRNAQGSATKMKRLGERAMEISSIVGAISRISAQTNMLALNAAIEASRAGEHGLGFTVVADEVRKLAEDCEEATKEIARLITTIQSETNEAVADLEKQAGQVEQQTQLATDAGGVLERIVGVSEQSARIVSEISEVAHQQAGDAAGLRDAMQNAGQVARDLQVAADRAQRTFEALHASATELARRVSPYRADGAILEPTSM